MFATIAVVKQVKYHVFKCGAEIPHNKLHHISTLHGGDCVTVRGKRTRSGDGGSLSVYL